MPDIHVALTKRARIFTAGMRAAWATLDAVTSAPAAAIAILVLAFVLHATGIGLGEVTAAFIVLYGKRLAGKRFSSDFRVPWAATRQDYKSDGEAAQENIASELAAR